MTRRRKKRRARKSRRPSRVRRFSLFLAFVLALVGAAYVAFLDYEVRSQFEGKRWALPARVYARPLELFPGLPLSADAFARELAVLNYRVGPERGASGVYRRSGGSFVVNVRPFTFWDGAQEGMSVRAQFSGGTLVSLSYADTDAPVGLVRMDPAHIGGIYPAHNEDRILVQLKDVPPLLIQTLIAVEDHGFYEHPGISLRAIARAMFANLRAGGTVQGGSTLTQQLVKNFFLSNERTLRRKINEAIMALLLEWHYTKDEILEAYLNEVYLGQDGNRAVHGFGLASHFYFDRPIADLKAEQIALLVGLVKGPSYYDPRRNPERARQRRNLVLDVLVEQGALEPDQALRAKAAALGVSPRAPGGTSSYPAIIDLVRRQLRRDYQEEDLVSEGLQIFTTFDPLVQRSAEEALAARTAELEKRVGLAPGLLQGAVVIASVEGGEVLAVVGGRDARFSGFNRALDAERPIGSLVKPAVYLAALEDPARYTLVTSLEDTPLRVKNHDGTFWEPKNYDKEIHGPVPLHAALAHSYNLATARLALDVGLPKVVDTLKRMGVERDLQPYPSLALGAAAMTPIEVVQMYETLAGGGFRTPLRAIREVLTADGQPLQRYPLKVQQAFDPAPVYLVNTALQEVNREGTGRSVYQYLSPAVAVAGKTGTTDDLRDSWYAGFTGDRLAVVWLGVDDNRPAGLSGASGALQVWGDIMRRIDPHPLQLVKPANVDLVWLDPVTGAQTDADCYAGVVYPFIAGSAPQRYAPCAGGGIADPVRRTLDWFRGVFR